jgi:hypothetical protein
VIVSHQHFMWFITAMAVGICVIWGAREVYLLLVKLPRSGREEGQDRRQWRDQIFGSIVGMVIIVMGLIGVYRYWSTH